MNDLKLYQESTIKEAKKRYSRVEDIPASIMCSLREGDHKAFEYIYLHYFETLTRFLSSLLRSQEEACEIAQEVFITLWEKRELFDEKKGVRRYIFKLAKYHVLNHFDHQKVHKKFEDFIQTDDICDLSADEIMQIEETIQLVTYAVKRMPERQREIFRMSRTQNMSYEEIAKELGISVNTVKFHMKKVLKELRELLSLFFYFVY